MAVLPMFPLGIVLLPGMVLPLHVFEPRYRQLVRDVRAADDRFGVVLISRGSEVGGGDARTDVGTVARVVQAEESPDGRWGLACVGSHRIRVLRWLEDDPYPRAVVEDWPEEPPGPPEDDRLGLQALVRRTAALRAELGEPAPPVGVELSRDPVAALYDALRAAVPGAADRQDVLATPSAAAMAELVARLVAEEAEVLGARLAGR